MRTIYKSALTYYSCKQMFDLVNDIDNYPNFLNWCSASNILEQNDKEITACIKINKSGFAKSFTTINTLEKDHKITMNLKDGPFKNLFGEWIFTELKQNACKVEFKLNFEFSSKIMDLALAPAFENIANSQLDSFVKQAKQIYKAT
jgi:ribosome-associated toxin RatA of RatAB toxin-antitoxin module